VTDITFVRTRHNYDSYRDFWSLVDLSGFPYVYVDEMEIENPDKVYILSPMNGELRQDYDPHRMSQRKATLFNWNLERPSGSGGISNYISDNKRLIDEGYVDAVIVSDRYLADLTGFRFLPLGSHESLGSPGTVDEKRFDLVHLSCYSYHRSILFHSPSVPKLTIAGMTVADNGWGAERKQRLHESRIMLAVHQDELPFIEPLRMALAAAYGLPVLLEYSQNINYFPSGVVMAPDGKSVLEVVSLAKELLTRYDWFYQEGLELRHYMTGTSSFRKCVESYL